VSPEVGEGNGERMGLVPDLEAPSIMLISIISATKILKTHTNLDLKLVAII